MKFCTIELAQLMSEAGVEKAATDLIAEEERILNILETIREENYIDPLYGHLSKMSYADWLEALKKTKSVSKIWY